MYGKCTSLFAYREGSEAGRWDTAKALCYLPTGSVAFARVGEIALMLSFSLFRAIFLELEFIVFLVACPKRKIFSR